MAKTYNVLTIEIKEDISDLITAKQGDTNSRYLDVYLRDNGRPMNLTGNEVKIYGKKKDGTFFFNNGEITDAVNGRCQFELTSQALAVAGELALEISIWQNNERTLTTQTFHVFVAPSVRNDRAIESSNEFNALVLMFQKLNEFIEDASYIIERIGLPEDTGGTTKAGTVMAKLNNLLSNWTSARAVKIDTIHDNIGKTTDTGGSNTVGTVMAKLNHLLTNWTSARATKLDNIGATGDTGGSSTAGTVMAKLNKLLTDWTTTRAGKIDTINTNASNVNTRLTSTRASRLDNIGTTTDTGGSATAGTMMAKLNQLLTNTSNTGTGTVDTVNNNIGTTKDTGGTSSAGTVMAKLNKLLTDWTATRAGYLTNLNSRLTATRAGYLDKLANFGATGDTGGSATAGTVMAKLNQLLISNTKQYKISSTVRENITKSVESKVLTNASITAVKIHQFHAKYDGCIAVYATVNKSNIRCYLFVLRSLHNYANISGRGSTKEAVTPIRAPGIFTSAIGSSFPSYYPIAIPNDMTKWTNIIFGQNYYLYEMNHYGTTLMDTTIPVKKGEEVVFMAFVNEVNTPVNVTIQIKYDEVTI